MWFICILFGALGFSNGIPVESRIIGGEEAPAQYAPHMVALFLEGIWHTTLICGGSLITRRVVLTAAHCITLFLQDDQLIATFKGRVGSNNWRSGGTVVSFASNHIHPRWDPDNYKFDGGLLVLKKELELKCPWRPIEMDFGLVGGDERAYVTGWGNTGPRYEEGAVHLAPIPDSLQLLYVTTLTHAQCVTRFSAAQWSDAPTLDHTAEICTFHSHGHGMCNGDSGSALVSASSGRQVGVVSWGFPCAVGAPDVFTRTSAIKDFVMEILRLIGDEKPKTDLHNEHENNTCSSSSLGR